MEREGDCLFIHQFSEPEQELATKARMFNFFFGSLDKNITECDRSPVFFFLKKPKKTLAQNYEYGETE